MTALSSTLALLVRHPPPTNSAGLTACATCANPVNVRVNVVAWAHWGAAADQRKKAPVHRRYQVREEVMQCLGARHDHRLVRDDAQVLDDLPYLPAVAGTSRAGSSIRTPSSAEIGPA